MKAKLMTVVLVAIVVASLVAKVKFGGYGFHEGW